MNGRGVPVSSTRCSAGWCGASLPLRHGHLSPLVPSIEVSSSDSPRALLGSLAGQAVACIVRASGALPHMEGGRSHRRCGLLVAKHQGVANTSVRSTRGSRMLMETAMSGHQTNKPDLFEIDKAIAAIAYLVEKTGASMYPVMKMMYLADKMHLAHYGRFIANDSYSAMKQGPVPSRTYNMIKHLRGEPARRVEDARALEFFVYGDEHKISLRKKPDYDELSGSDLECLDEVVSIYGRIGPWAVRNMSHDEAWEAAWRSRFFKKSVPMETTSIAAQFEDGETLIEHLKDRHPGEARPAPHLRTGTGG